MANVKVIRQTCLANDTLSFDFDVLGFKFLVKNLTEGDICLTLSSEVDEENNILIPGETAQVVFASEVVELKHGTNTITVTTTSESDKGVEVQCVKWKEN